MARQGYDKDLVQMRIEGKLIYGNFIERLNKYTGIIEIGSINEYCFIPNPGRLEELLTFGNKIIVKEINDIKRKNKFDLIFVYHNDLLVSIDSRLPNKLFIEGVKKKIIQNFENYKEIKPEYNFGDSRLDFLFVDNENKKCLIECKSCTLVKDDLALFPDAPTDRGTRHLYELVRAKKEGYRSCIVFIIQRNDAIKFAPNIDRDPSFGSALKMAYKEGVEVYAYSCKIDIGEININKKIDINIHQDH